MSFRLDPTADSSMISWMGELYAAPRELQRVFGPHHNAGDRYKISGQWLFTDEYGNTFAIRDWKSTSFWDPDFPPPLEFWRMNETVEFTLASHEIDVTTFREWVIATLGTNSGKPGE